MNCVYQNITEKSEKELQEKIAKVDVELRYKAITT